MKIAIIGSRGIPAVYGGFETFVQEIAPLLKSAGHEVMVMGEKNNSSGLENYGAVQIMESVYKKSKNPLLFYLDSLRRVAGKYDVVLVCGVGASIFYPFFRTKTTTIITNVDGLEHLRAKFSFIKKVFVKLSQHFAKQFSEIIIADSEAVGKYWREELHGNPDKVQVIAYGAHEALPLLQSLLDEYAFQQNSYYLIIARLVPENHIREIIEGFLMSGSEKKLVIVGGLENSDYLEILRKYTDPKIVFTGAIYNKQVLDTFRRGAFAYFHGHSVGGTNPSLLEAMAASCFCICHDNIFNREVNSQEQLYFRNAIDLKTIILKAEKMSLDEINTLRKAGFQRVGSRYTWRMIGELYLNLLRKIDGRKNTI